MRRIVISKRGAMNSLSPTAQGTVFGGATAYLSLAPNLTTLTMYAFSLDALPEKVAAAAASSLTAMWTGCAMIAVAGFARLLARLKS